MSKYKSIPITAAKRLAKDYNKDQIIIVAWDASYKKEHVTTYGKSLQHCREAAQGGSVIKYCLGWPIEDCTVVPARIKAKQSTNLYKVFQVIELCDNLSLEELTTIEKTIQKLKQLRNNNGIT